MKIRLALKILFTKLELYLLDNHRNFVLDSESSSESSIYSNLNDDQLKQLVKLQGSKKTTRLEQLLVGASKLKLRNTRNLRIEENQIADLTKSSELVNIPHARSKSRK